MKLQAMDVRGEAQLRPAFEVVEKAIADKAFPGATLAVGIGKVSRTPLKVEPTTRTRRPRR